MVTCGYETEAQITVRDCVVPNVFTPDGFGPGGNNSFRIRGLDGFQGSQLTVFNRYGVAVFKDETTSNDEFELVWSGDYNNGNSCTSRRVPMGPDQVRRVQRRRSIDLV